MSDLKIIVQSCPPPEVVVIHFSRRLIKRAGAVHIDFPVDTSSDCVSLVDEMRVLMHSLDRIDGLTSASSSLYNVQFVIGMMFSWANVLPQIYDAIREAFNVGDLVIEYTAPMHAHFTPPTIPELPEV